MRGPLMAPSSIARLSPNTGPPMSRTVVKPRIKVASACRAAIIWRYEGLAVVSSGMAVAAMNECQCASMSPGINTRPPAAITRTSALASTAIGVAICAQWCSL